MDIDNSESICFNEILSEASTSKKRKVLHINLINSSLYDLRLIFSLC